MPSNIQRISVLLLLLAPLLLSVILVMLDFPVRGRDDVNYLSELEVRPYLLAAPDQLSWIVLKLSSSLFSDPLLGLRAAGFLICLATCWVLMRKTAGEPALTYFLISVAPLYWIIYFNQVRSGIGFAIVLLFYVRGRTILAPFAGALAHVSMIVLIFPPALIIAPFTLDLAQFLDPESFAAVRFAAYRDLSFILMPWYFGWELVALALILLTEKKPGRAIGLVIYAIAVRLLADRLSVDVARRLLEVGLFAYSPILAYLKTREPPTIQMLLFFVALGALSAYATFAGGVITLG